MLWQVQGDARQIPLRDETVQTVITSPPYYGLRNYHVTGQIGLEKTYLDYVEAIVQVFREVRRVLKSDGTVWLNLGDSYYGSGQGFGDTKTSHKQHVGSRQRNKPTWTTVGLKPKDLIGIPWRAAFALQADGWWLRSDIIWCLSGGTWVYARTRKGDMPMTIKDLYRLKPETVQLWNGQRWTRLRGISKSKRHGNELELVLRSGERISCTPTHKFPTERGLLEASDIQVGDVIQSATLPEPDTLRNPQHLGIDAAWLAGLYIAEGSHSGDCIQIAGHSKETERWERVRRIAESYGGTATRTVDGNCMNIRLYGKILNAILKELVTGRTAKDKGFAPVVWRYGNDFISAMVDGYLSGDSHHEPHNNRWQLGFTRNYNLERDLRTACARLGYALVLKMAHVPYNGGSRPTFRGELRKTRSGHHNERSLTAVVEIRKSRCREVYDLGVEDEPHVFALASGVLTHNSKPNPMPESVTDRPTRSHEYLFLLTKSARYYYNAAAIRTPLAPSSIQRLNQAVKEQTGSFRGNGGMKTNGPMKAVGGPRTDKQRGHSRRHDGFNDRWDAMEKAEQQQNGANVRSVWWIATQGTSLLHFATFPEALVRPCILAGSRPGDLVLDPFAGTGTVGKVALEYGRRAVMLDLNYDYLRLDQRKRQPQIGMGI